MNNDVFRRTLAQARGLASVRDRLVDSLQREHTPKVGIEMRQGSHHSCPYQGAFIVGVFLQRGSTTWEGGGGNARFIVRGTQRSSTHIELDVGRAEAGKHLVYRAYTRQSMVVKDGMHACPFEIAKLAFLRRHEHTVRSD